MTEKELNIIRGKLVAGVAKPEDMLKLFEVMDRMEELLDEVDQDDGLGTEGWRHRMGWD